MDEKLRSEMRVAGEDLLKKVKQLVHEGNVRRIIIKDDQGKVYLELPMSVGVVGALLLPVWAAIGALAAMAANFTLEVVRRE